MKKRILQNGTEVEELDKPVNLTILTKCPKKWKIIDLETGQQYVATGEYEIYKQWKLEDNA
jgi:hypothetical protein